MRAATSSSSDLPDSHTRSSTSSQGIMPLSQYEKSRK